MKKILASFALLTTVLTISLGLFGIQLIHRVYDNEIHHTLNLAGALLREYPDAEGTIMEAIHDEDLLTYQEGLDVLSHYGYDGEQSIREDPSWLNFIRIYLSGLAAFLFLALLLEWAFFWRLRRRQRRQEEELLTILDRYFSGDYHAIENKEGMEALDSRMAEILTRLGSNLEEKTAELAEERDNTKTLVTDISHQLKTPVSALKTCFSMYLESDTLEEQQEFLERCQQQMDKLEALIASLIQCSCAVK